MKKQRHQRLSQKGLTLIELLIAMVIAAILLGFAVPSFQGSIKKGQIESLQHDFSVAVQFARSEAVARNAHVSICGSSNGSTCNIAHYDNGWIVFVDDGASVRGNKANAIRDAGEELLKMNRLSDVNTLRGKDSAGTNTSRFGFNQRGYLNQDDNITLTICEKSGADAKTARGVMMGISGRTTQTRDSNADGVHEDAAITDLSC